MTAGRRGRALGLLLLAGAFAPWAPATASAHLGHVVLRAERYLKIDAGARHARVVVSLTLGSSEAVRVLRAADEDGDGSITEAEADAYLTKWGKGLQKDLPIELDGERVQVQWGDGYLNPIGRIRAVPGNVEMVARVPLDGGRHRITVRDRMRVEKYERTDVAFDARESVELVAAGVGERPGDVARRLAYGRSLGRGSIDALTAIVEVPGPSRQQRIALYAGAGALVVLAAAAWLALRRRRKRGTPAS